MQKSLKLLRIILPIALSLGVLVSLLVIVTPVHATSGPYYWYGGSGTWSDYTNHWSTNSGNSPPSPASNAPTSADDVIFDSNSFTGAGQSVQLQADGNCKNITWTGATNSPTLEADSIGRTLNIYGDATFITAMTIKGANNNNGNLLTLNFMGGVTHSLTPNNANVSYATNGGYNFATVRWQFNDSVNLLSDMVSLLNNGNTISVLAGTFTTNGYDIKLSQAYGTGYTTGVLSSTGSTTRTINLGDSIITCDTVTLSGSNLSFNAGTSSIVATGPTSSSAFTFSGGGYTFYDVTLYTTSRILSGTNTFHNLTISGNDVADAYIDLPANQTVTGTFTTTGYSASHRLLIKSDTLHTQRTISAGVVSASNTLFRDINATGAGNWNLSAQTDIGNCAGNTGITFPAGISVYATQIPGNVNWSSTANWASGSNGIPGTGRVPLPQDTAVFDAYSIGVPGIIITFDVSNLSGMNTLNASNNPQFNGTTDYFYNSVRLGTCLWNVTSDTYFYGQTAQNISGDFSAGSGNLRFDLQSGSFSQSGALTCGGTIYLTSGIWVTEGYAVTAKTFDSSTTTYNRALWMGNADSTLSSTFTLNGTVAGNKWNVASTNLNIDQIESTIILTNTGTNGQTFTGGGMTYYDLVIEGSGSYTLTFAGTNTFNDVYIIRSNAVYPDILTATSAAAKTVTGNVKQTINHLYSPLYGTTVTSIGTTDWEKASGLVALDYLAFTGGANTSVATGGATPFLAGSHSTGSPQTGWSFTDATAPTISAQAATLTTRTTAVLNGSLDSLGSWSTEGVYIYFQYDETGAYTAPTETSQIFYTSTGIKSAGITGLDFNTTYHFRMVCLYNGSSYLYADDTTFLTLGAPVALTQDPTGLTGTEATLQGLLVDLGDYTDVFASFQYGATIAYGSVTAPETHLDALSPFSATIGGLTSGATYHYRAVLRYNAVQYAYGADVSFVSSPTLIPGVTTLPATTITTTGATLQGQVTTMGSAITVSVYFEYGTTVGYGTGTLYQTEIAAGNFNQSLAGLLIPATTYHFRANLVYGSTTINGADEIFTTNANPTAGAAPLSQDMATVPVNSGGLNSEDVTQSNNLLTPMFAPWAVLSNIPLIGFFLIITTALLIFVIVWVMKKTQNQFIGGFILILGEICLWKIGIYELWFIIVTFLVCMSIVVFERKPSL